MIMHPAWSSEATKLFEAAQQFGLDVLRNNGDKLILMGAGKSLAPRTSVIPAVGSAFNFRTVAGLACLSSKETIVEGDSSMLARPVKEHLGFVKDLGGEITDISDSTTLRIRVRGSRRLGGETIIDTTHSSQVLTAALLISPLAEKPVTLHCTDNPVGQGYVDLTLTMMREQGAVVEQDGTAFRVHPAAYHSRLHHVASDFTALSYLAGAVATAKDGEITVANYHPSSLSSEIEFFAVLAELGIHAVHDPVTRSLRIQKQQPRADAIEIDGCNIPTVVPTLAGLAPFINAKITLRNAAHVNNHKCRRIEVMIRELNRMGCRIEPTFGLDGLVDGFSTTGRQSPVSDVVVDSHGDHRVFMSLATAALGAQRPTVVNGVEYLHASFPDYLEVLAGIGVRVNSTPEEFRLAH
jgi:3-phosphoshikimate 1-carboxyvinyltransferase